jgi:hypothetical protein
MDIIECKFIQLFQLRLSTEQSGKVEYERERLLGIAKKLMNLLAIPSSLSRRGGSRPTPAMRMHRSKLRNHDSCCLKYIDI